jgi:hypothetical protein
LNIYDPVKPIIAFGDENNEVKQIIGQDQCRNDVRYEDGATEFLI